MGNRINFFFTEAIRSLSTNVATSLAATLTMIIALFIVGGVWFVGGWAQDHAKSTAQDAGTVRIFLVDTVKQDQVNALQASLTNMRPPGGGSGSSTKVVESVRYIDKNGALREAKKMFKDQPDLIANLAGNPFPAELRVKLNDPSQAEYVASQMRDQPGVQPGRRGVTYGGEIAKRVVKGAKVLETIAGVVIVLFVIAAIFLVRNTIRLSIFARRREIEVMKLVGASNSFVRWPFMIEGLLCGLFAAVTAIAVLAMVKSVIERVVKDALDISNGLTGPNEAIIGLGLIALGIALGSLGSALSIRRYLQV